jgi:hypothetical protein
MRVSRRTHLFLEDAEESSPSKEWLYLNTSG